MGLGVHGSILKLECAAHRWHICCLWHDASAALGNAGDISLLSDVTAKLARAHAAAAEQPQARGGEAVAALRSVDYTREVPLDAMLDGTVPCSACSTQHRTVQHAACDVQHTACNVQHATCNVQRAACSMRCATCSTRNVQHATCNLQHAARNMQHRHAPYHASSTCTAHTCTLRHAR